MPADFTDMPPHEVDRRRQVSVAEMREREKTAFAKWYQEQCDRDYWTLGKCCAGCDHWRSDMGNLGECVDAGIVSGDQVARSMGVQFCSHTPPPGFPLTRGDFYCGQFRDEFDWKTLDHEYLERIGAMENGKLKEKPTQIAGD